MPETGFTQSFVEAAIAVINNHYMRATRMMYINVMKVWAVDNSSCLENGFSLQILL